QPGRRRLPARPGEPGARHPVDPRRRHGRVRGPAAAAVRESDLTSPLSREHVVANPLPGLGPVGGGKDTTYRLMAREGVDAVAHGLDWRTPPSCTDRVPLAGADGYLALWNARSRLATSSGLHVARIEHLLRRYGSLAREVLGLIAADPVLGRPLDGADDY